MSYQAKATVFSDRSQGTERAKQIKRAAWNKSFARRNNQRRGICAKRAQGKFEKTQL